MHALGAVGLGLWAACCCWSRAPALWQHQRWESPCSRGIAKWIWQKQKHSMLNVLAKPALLCGLFFFSHKPPNKHYFGA